VVPNRELAKQVEHLALRLVKESPLRVEAGVGLQTVPPRRVDIFVATPGCVQANLNKVICASLRFLVLDEADVLLAPFSRQIQDIMTRLKDTDRKSGTSRQYAVVGVGRSLSCPPRLDEGRM
jgi:superfamily II DNA/RNA helicase